MAAAAAAARSPIHPTLDPSIHSPVAADRLPTGILQTIRRSLPLVEYLRFPAVCTAWRAASRQQGKLTHCPRGAPWLFTLSNDHTILYAIDCLSNIDSPKVYRFPLPDHLHGYEIFSSLSHRLVLEKRESLSGILLFNPFSPSSSPTQVASLPPSASLRPRYQIYSVVADTGSGIAVALPSGDCLVAYTRLDCNSDDPDIGNPGGSWIDLTHLIPDPPSDDFIFLRSAVHYKGGLFCVLDRTGNKVFALDFSTSPTVTLADMTFNLPNNYSRSHQPVDWCTYQSAILINSASSLFLVRWRNLLQKHGVKKRREIDVYRLDDDAGANGSYKWVPMKSLGDRSFFVGRNQSISMSALDFPDLKSNRVYLPHDATTRIAGEEYICPYEDEDNELGYHLVYNLEDASWGVFYDQIHNDHLSPDDYHPWWLSVWMIPHARSDSARLKDGPLLGFCWAM